MTGLPTLLTIAEVSAWMRVHRATIYRMIQAGTFPPGIAIGGNRRRWRVDELERWLTERAS